MKLCTDCKHYYPAIGGPRCSRTIDPVTGGPEEFCFIERKHGDCGHAARHFEASPPAKRNWLRIWLA